ncbi:MAG: hypothetical protein K6F05_05335 [Succinivibrio sp.]|nr:hypothetical protein [Succinivibrio sp.]
MLVASESLCAACGIVLFGLGLLCIFIPRHFKFGVLTLLLGDFFFVLAIAYPRRIYDFLTWWGFDHSYLEQPKLVAGGLCGLIIFALWYALFRLFTRVLFRRVDVANTAQHNIPPEELPINRQENDDRRFALDIIDKHFFKKSMRVKNSRKLLRKYDEFGDATSPSSQDTEHSESAKP